MVLLMWRFDRVTLLEQFTTTAVAIVYTLGIFWTLPDEFRYVLHGANDLVILYSGGAQVIETYRVQHTGAHSIVTTSMNLIGEVLRVFTTLEETNGDVNMLLSYALCIFLSLTMFVQYFWYRTNTERFFMEQEKKKKE